MSEHPRMLRKRIAGEWRKRGHGRLYWRQHNRRWRDWQNGAVAVAIDGAVRTWFMSTQAILDYMNGDRT